MSARLCRLLREEVEEELERDNPGLTTLAAEWRNLLFPEASNEQFADGYAQAVTFGLLVARVRDVDISNIEKAAAELRKAETLIGTALRLLIDNPDVKEPLGTALSTLTRVLNVVDWQTMTKGSADAWLYFYEEFLEVYDNDLRKKTGSYYTPPEVVSAMVRLTDEALQNPRLFNLPRGLAAPEVTICDPATGTGTFLLGILRHIARSVQDSEGTGHIGPAIAAATQRIFGFELQFGPFAVAQLRMIAELQVLAAGAGPLAPADMPTPKLYITDTLGDPYADAQFSSMTAAIGESRKEANRIKREEEITVVIGNPPYKNKAKGMGGWIENGNDAQKSVSPAMASWSPPPEWGVGAHAHHLKNLYVYFWRWAALKVFGSDWKAVVQKDANYDIPDQSGIVCFITVAGFLNGPGFQKMREQLRRDCSDIWVIDCSPEGHQPTVSTRIFQGVQQPVCIVLAARTPEKDRSKPASLHFMELPEGHREKLKFKALETLSFGSSGWVPGPKGWRDPFLGESASLWATMPALEELMDYSVSGVTTHRTWVIAPDKESLIKRWDRLKAEKDVSRKAMLFHEDRDRRVDRKRTIDLGSFKTRDVAVSEDQSPVVGPIRYAYRTFDRQWLIPDHRLLSQARSQLWEMYSQNQIHLTALEAHSPKSGPAIGLSDLIPDLDHYHGRGGRVYPLWRDGQATASNIEPALLRELHRRYRFDVPPEDMMAYIAAVMANPAFTERFKKDLKRPGLRVPLTADRVLFQQAAKLGRRIIWLHTFGERFVDPSADRPNGSPRMEPGKRPQIPAGAAIPGAPNPLPDEMHHDPATNRLHIGDGYVGNVTKAMWDYDVSGMPVIKHWFSYRKRDRSRPIIGDRRPPSPLSDIQPDHWPAEYTTDLIDMLNVLGLLIELEPEQAELLDRIMDGPLISNDKLLEKGAIGEKDSG
ncbi:MAG: N-6 DNA methylase [Ahrensia sp.]|nr:N-6 DNA methylase [Ahrensia sp.]